LFAGTQRFGKLLEEVKKRAIHILPSLRGTKRRSNLLRFLTAFGMTPRVRLLHGVYTECSECVRNDN
ncbi:MAG: hypothetical protein ACREOB_10595, partial [Thermodesulfobacteriota bacterium]